MQVGKIAEKAVL